MPLVSNADLAELLAGHAKKESGVRQKALKRAARSAFLWTEEAREIVDSGRSLTELHGVGAFIEQLLLKFLESPPARRPTRDPLRRDFLTLAEARAILSRDSRWAKRVHCDLHMHTTWSDGSGSVAEMAEAGKELGHEYIAISDHSQGLKIAGGIDETQVAQQAREINDLNQKGEDKRPVVLHSIELNVNPRGEGDMQKNCLTSLDFVIGSFHSALRSKEDQTERYLSALQNPCLHILGHPRGRVYNYRVGLSADWARVFAEATRLDKAVEIDCYPDRQDLNVDLLKLARAAGTRVSLGTDAHHPWQLEFIEFGLAAALKAKIPAERIVNFMPLAEFKQWIAGVQRD
ncbi:MAG: PHP domain-containing protein [Verrucomicrobiota bacterium]|nr:PHP domain-containing protein [Verrucomicrobiota bacterium]MDQ6938797.1 PHP domain-containing protein [Verrucomicrobiota bacterium]